MSAPVGLTKTSPVAGGTAHPKSTKFDKNCKHFSDLLGIGPGLLSVSNSAERPVVAPAPSLGSRRDEPQASADSPRPRPGDGDLDSTARGDEAPCWQAGATDPLALFGVGSACAAVVPPPVAAPAALDPLVAELLRSIAWGGDRRRGTARLELGSGRYRGLSVKVEAVGDSLQIDLEAPAGVDAAALGARLVERFEARGLRVDSLTCR